MENETVQAGVPRGAAVTRSPRATCSCSTTSTSTSASRTSCRESRSTSPKAASPRCSAATASARRRRSARSSASSPRGHDRARRRGHPAAADALGSSGAASATCRGPRHLRRPDRRGEPAARRARRRAALRPRLRPLPRAARARRQRAGTLSGGQQQMLAIARALLNDNRAAARRRADEGARAAARHRGRHVLERVSRARRRSCSSSRTSASSQRIARDAVVLDQGRVVHAGRARSCSPTELVRTLLSVLGSRAMSTFVLLTITGLGLGAMYFLIASGLSLIYGLMGVLNFAHGAFLTVGAYAAVVHRTQARRRSIGAASLPARGLFGLVVGGVLAALVELVLIRPLYLRHIEQVLVTVGLSLALVALVQAIWGPTRALRRAGLARRDDDDPRREDPERPLRRDRAPRSRSSSALAGVPALHALRADHPRRRREPRDGDGARHRRAQGVHARLRARRRSRPRSPGCSPASTSATIDPKHGTSLADLRVHRRRDRRPRLDRRLRGRRRHRRADAAVRELLRVVGRRRPRGRPAARDRPARPARRALARSVAH